MMLMVEVWERAQQGNLKLNKSLSPDPYMHNNLFIYFRKPRFQVVGSHWVIKDRVLRPNREQLLLIISVMQIAGSNSTRMIPVI